MKRLSFKNIVVFIIFILALNAVMTYLSAAEEKKPKKEVSLEINRPITDYKAESLRDPFMGRIIERPVLKQVVRQEVKKSQPVVAPSGIAIQGIVWGGRATYAIVNNKVVKTNDMINNDVQVVEINKDGIVVLYKDSQFTFGSPAAVNAHRK